MSNATKIPKTAVCLLPDFTIAQQTKYLRTTYLIVGPLHMLSILASLILNALIILAVFKKRRLRRSSTYLLCSINVKDIILVTILQPMAVYRSFTFIIEGNFCAKTAVDSSRLFLIFLYRSVSLTTMVLISIDRWIAVWRPNSYKNVFTTKRIFVAVALVWAISIAISFVATYVIEPKHRYQLVLVQFGITVLVVSVIQIGVYIGIKKHGKKIADLSSSQKRQIKIERSIAIIVLYVIIALAVVYIPLFVVSAIRFLENKNYFVITGPWMELLLYGNAVANPIIWLKTNTYVKHAVADAVLECFRPSIHEIESVDMSTDRSSKAVGSTNKSSVH